MFGTYLKKSIAVSAVLASSVAAAVGSAAAAHAAPAGPANSPLTLDRGAWAPDGSRSVFVDAHGAILTAAHGEGGAPYVVDPAEPGVSRSHPTWFAGGTAIVFSETVGGVSKLMSVPAYTDPKETVRESNPLSYLNGLTLGTETAPDSNGSTLAFQHHNGTTGHDEIWVQDSFGRGSGGPILAADDGAAPSVSPDGKTIAFLRKDPVSGLRQIWTVAWNGQNATPHAGTPVQFTTDPKDHTNPTWSPDGVRMAWEAGTGPGGTPTEVDSLPVHGGQLRQESAHAGVPGYQPLVQDTVTRLAGADRIGTAIATSQAQWPTAPYHSTGSADRKYQAHAVVLARYDLPYDALGGSTLAATNGAPLLLTQGDYLDPAVKAEISRVLGSPAGTATGKPTVYVLGGEQALSPAVFTAVKALGYQVKRIAGADRYETSVAIAKEVTGPYNGPTRILVATGKNFPDALSAGAAAQISAPGPSAGVVVLSDDTTLPTSVKAYIASNGHAAGLYAVGGQADAALTAAGIKHTPLVGADRYQTSYLVARTFFGSWQDFTAPSTVGFATGTTWPDALAGGAFMSEQRGPLLLVDPATGLPSTEAQGWLSGWAPAVKNAYVFGGTAALGTAVPTNVAGDISGPAGATFPVNPKS